RADQSPQVLDTPVVDPAQPLRDLLLAPSPVAHGEVDRQELAREREHARAPHLVARVATLALDSLEHLVGAAPLPGVEHLLEQRVPVHEVPVEAAARDAELLREGLDPHGVRAAGCERAQAGVDPAAAWCARRCRHWLDPYSSVRNG